jgi:hypothetical protein
MPTQYTAGPPGFASVDGSPTLVDQQVFGIALGYEDLIDHARLRHDPVLATLAGKLEARRPGRAARALVRNPG